MKPVFSLRLSLASLLRRVLAWRFLKFGIVGASGTVINLGLLYYAQEHLFAAIQQPEMRLNLSLALAIFLPRSTIFSGTGCGHGPTAGNITTGRY